MELFSRDADYVCSEGGSPVGQERSQCVGGTTFGERLG